MGYSKTGYPDQQRDKATVFRDDEFVKYPTNPPFHPSQRYPEYPFTVIADAENRAYAAVRNCLKLAGLDSSRFGKSEWNPLGEFINPGDKVVLKPNLIKQSHPRDPSGWEYTITHPSVIRAVADYVWIATGNSGTVTIADAPQTDSSYSEIVTVTGLDKIAAHYSQHDLDLELIDLRREEWVFENGVVVSRRDLPGDPKGAIAFDLGDDSCFKDHRGSGNYYGADYDSDLLNERHSNGHHMYLISKSVIEADVIVNLPKLKTHKKTGITVGLKNFVGVTADKNWLPHHTEGSPEHGGDEHPNPGIIHKIERISARFARSIALKFPRFGPRLYQLLRGAGEPVFGDTESIIRSGNWFGNDTTWRMALDLNLIISYGDTDGTLRDQSQSGKKRLINIVDGLIGGQKNGPLNPDPIVSKLIGFSNDTVAIDSVFGRLMGFDLARLSIVSRAYSLTKYPLTDFSSWNEVEVNSNVPEWNMKLGSISPEACMHFEPHFGWVGHMEAETP